MLGTVWVASAGLARWTAMALLRDSVLWAVKEVLQRWALRGWPPAFLALRETLEREAVQQVLLECSQEAALLSEPAAPVYRNSY